jgi:uncharacterized protein (TIGR00255 family)
MLQSMTAFGRSQGEGEWGSAIWELRSFNHRYLEISFRLPEILRELEPHIREILHQSLQRGKIECSLRFQPGVKLGALISLNNHLLQQLIQMVTSVSHELPQLAQVNVMDLLTWNGIVIEEPIQLDIIREPLLTLFKQAVADLLAGREREGITLYRTIYARIHSITQHAQAIKQRLPGLLDRQREKIFMRLEEAKVQLDPLRLEQEMVYFAQKIDISEELDRLQSHVAEVKRTLEKREIAGRRLDFMMQELNREANTLAAKSVDADVTHAAVAVKVLIEQIREQVQNVE